MSIEINGVVKEETAYDKEITFTYEGQEYAACLHWDKWDGYDLTFTEVAEPEWATNWEWNDGETLAYILDGLTDEVLEGQRDDVETVSWSSSNPTGEVMS
jgi:hypothetical protein